MRFPDDQRLDSIERHLAARAGLAPAVGHRDRVLAAVRDTLDQRHGPPPRAGSGIDAGATAALVFMALSATLVIVAPWLVATYAAASLPTEPRFVAQARAAGIDLPLAVVAATSRPGEALPSPPSERLSERHSEAWRLRTLLTGEL